MSALEVKKEMSEWLRDKLASIKPLNEATIVEKGEDREVLLMGDTRLRQVSQEIKFYKQHSEEVKEEVKEGEQKEKVKEEEEEEEKEEKEEEEIQATLEREKLAVHKALWKFRKEQGYGRSIAAPQIGVNKRLLAINLGHGQFSMINPVIEWRSSETLTLWDDCLSLPSLMIKKRRACSISFRFVDDEGRCHRWLRCPADVSELIQHEVDHLDGVLAVDCPEGPLSEAIIYRQVYLAHLDFFHAQVDYFIQPT